MHLERYQWMNFFKVIIDFEIDIQERWTPELTDSSTDEFTNLANIYIAPFKNSFLQDESSQVGDSTISFAEVRVLRFILIFFSRRGTLL